MNTPQYPPLVPLTLSMPPDAKAFFSTFGGQFEPRNSFPRTPIILRSFHEDDRDAMVAKYQREYPAFCKTITHPIMPSDLYDYFDAEGIHKHGSSFLVEVLRQIASNNASQQIKLQREFQNRQNDVADFARRWVNTNGEAFFYLNQPVTADYGIKELFTEEDIKGHAEDFLSEVAIKIKHMRLMEVQTEEQRDQAQGDHATRSQQQHEQVNTNRTILSEFQGGLPRYPSNQNTPVFSAPEHLQRDPRSQSNMLRLGNFSDSPADRRMSSTGNAHNAMIGGLMNMPPPGHPVPFAFNNPYQMYHIGPPPMTSRQATYDGNSIPRGKKNPTKRMSDDARRGSNTSTSGRSSFSRRPSSNRQQMRSPEIFHPFPGPQAQPLFPNPQASGPIWHSNTQQQLRRVENLPPTPSLHASAQQPQVGVQYHAQGQVHDPYPIVPDTAIGPGSSITNLHGSMPEPAVEDGAQNILPSTGQATAQTETVVDPNSFGDRLSVSFSELAGPDNLELDPQKTTPGPSPNTGQGGAQCTPERSIPVTENCKIWIGGLPKGISQTEIEEVLRQCPGFVDISGPKTKYNDPNVSFCFADIMAAPTEQGSIEGHDHSHVKSGGPQHNKKSSRTRGHGDVVSADGQNMQAESTDPAIVRSSRHFEASASKPDDPKTDRPSQLGRSTRGLHPGIGEQFSGPTISTAPIEQTDPVNETALRQIPKAVSSPSALDGSPEAAIPPNDKYSKKIRKNNKRKVDASKKPYVSDGKERDPPDEKCHSEQTAPHAGGKSTIDEAHGQNTKSPANTLLQDPKAEFKTSSTKSSSNKVFGTHSKSTTKPESHQSPPFVDPKTPHHDAQSAIVQKHGSSASYPGKGADLNTAHTSETLKTTAMATRLSRGQGATSQAMTRETSASTHERGASVSPKLASTTATSPLPTERSNSIVDNKKSSQLTQYQAPTSGIDPAQLRNKLEDSAGAKEVTWADNEPSAHQDPIQEKQTTNVPLTSIAVGKTVDTVPGPTDASWSIQGSSRGRKNNSVSKAQNMVQIPNPISGQTRNSTQGELVPEKLQMKGNPSSKITKTEAKSGTKPDMKTTEKTNAKPGMVSSSKSNVYVDEGTDLKTAMGQNVKTNSKADASNTAADATGQTDYAEKGSPKSEIDAGKASQQRASAKTPLKAPATVTANAMPSLSGSGYSSPERKKPSFVPERSSSLAVVSTPIKTHHRKKPRNFTPSKEEAETVKKESTEEKSMHVSVGHPSTNTSGSVVRESDTFMPQEEEPNKVNEGPPSALQPGKISLSPDTSAERADPHFTNPLQTRQMTNPEPETPWDGHFSNERHFPKPKAILLDTNARILPVPNLHHQKCATAVVDYYREKSRYQNAYLKGALKSDIPFSQYEDLNPTSGDPLFRPPSHQSNAIYTWRESGFHRLSESCQLEPENPILARLPAIPDVVDAKESVEDSLKRGKSLIKVADYVHLNGELQAMLGLRSAEEQGAKYQTANTSQLTSKKNTISKQALRADEAEESQIERSDTSKDLYAPLVPYKEIKLPSPKEVDPNLHEENASDPNLQELTEMGSAASENSANLAGTELQGPVASLFAEHAQDALRFNLSRDWSLHKAVPLNNSDTYDPMSPAFTREGYWLTIMNSDDSAINNHQVEEGSEQAKRAVGLVNLAQAAFDDMGKPITKGVESKGGDRRTRQIKRGNIALSEKHGFVGLSSSQLVQRDINTAEKSSLATRTSTTEKTRIHVDESGNQAVGLEGSANRDVFPSGLASRLRSQQEIKPGEFSQQKQIVHELQDSDFEKEEQELEKKEQKFEKKKQEAERLRHERAFAGSDLSRLGSNVLTALEGMNPGDQSVQQATGFKGINIDDSGPGFTQSADVDMSIEKTEKEPRSYESSSSGPIILTPPSDTLKDKDNMLLIDDKEAAWVAKFWVELNEEDNSNEDGGKALSKTTAERPESEKGGEGDQIEDAEKAQSNVDHSRSEKGGGGDQTEDDGQNRLERVSRSPEFDVDSPDISDNEAVANYFP
ncbi:hypothetical protein P7C71_g1062, partial [Lecanoromycetidae sp. Uapishka_2]